jgi:renalase
LKLEHGSGFTFCEIVVIRAMNFSPPTMFLINLGEKGQDLEADRNFRRGNSPTIAIVGAGIAGLVTGQRLHEAGLAVTLFEKSRGLGGRAATRRTETELRFDHGAPAFGVNFSRFADQVRQWEKSGCIARWEPRRVRIKGSSTQKRDSSVPRYVGVPGMSALGRHLGEGLTVISQTRIARISRPASDWALTDDQGSSHGPFDQLVIAIPAPQAAELLGDHPFAEQAKRAVMVPCWAGMFAWDQPIPLDWDEADVADSPIAWAAREGSKPGRLTTPECWVAHASTLWTKELLSHDREEVASLLATALMRLLGTANLPTFSTAHRWMYSTVAESADAKALHDKSVGLTVAGDWLIGTGVEAACESGRVAAQYLMT